ncbi:S46 family peptidase [Tautonia sociabilis]|uniref:Dipeptidyl-peptidase n=1 Tax=Tautonia sociabilis TaxID=2080755 RepID=A0A432MPG6_9BACT|nr:S46 family peptidase [Tautonia sociabilis]RUL89057.1 S46 family peptidase [Tautonia sociabilis]
MIRLRRRMALIGLLSLMTTTPRLSADEGMWVFNNLPLEQLKATYGFEPSEEWISRLRSSAVRFNNGGSGSFVSADGLVMTNHHVAADTLQKLSTAAEDYYRVGFLARSREAELPAPDLELNVTSAIRDVSDRVNAAVTPEMSDAEAATARRAAMAAIEQEATAENGMRNDVVTLYQGGQYHLYTYKTYTDVRLVFAPEFDIAFFGGDEDNFEYPRYCLDVAFFRAYENGQPAHPEHFLRWSDAGSKPGDLVFVAGHPGRTSRLNTMAHLEYFRETGFPFLLDLIRQREAFLSEYSRRGEEQARQAKEDLFSYQNSRKARLGGYQGLQDEAFMRRKAERERALRDQVSADPEMAASYGDAWEKIAGSRAVAAENLASYNMLERGLAFESRLFQIARTVARLVAEDRKPNEERLREYRASNRPSLELDLYSEAPIYPEFEAAKLANALDYWRRTMGADDPVVHRVLGGREPEQVARELVEGTRLADVSFRKQLVEGGLEAVQESDDPMIRLALAVDPEARAIRKTWEDRVEGVETAQYARIAEAMFKTQGDSVYPDATFTLRLAFGTVKGWEEDGKTIPPYTVVEGLFERAESHGNVEPYRVPESWVEAKEDGRLDLQTPMNFVSTADIIGGNSGSPVVDRDGQVVGLIFDGNIHSLILDFGYDDTLARAVAVDSRVIAEALRSVYGAEALLRELTEGR